MNNTTLLIIAGLTLVSASSIVPVASTVKLLVGKLKAGVSKTSESPSDTKAFQGGPSELPPAGTVDYINAMISQFSEESDSDVLMFVGDGLSIHEALLEVYAKKKPV